MTAPAAPMTPVRAPGLPRMARYLRAREAGTLALVLVVFLATTLKNHNFASGSSVQQLLVGASLVALLGVGETMVIVTRNIDLSVGSTLGLSAFVVGNLFRTEHIPVWSGFVIAIALGATVGAINGAITTLVKVPSLVVTLAMLYIIRGLDSKLVNGSIVVPSQVPHAFITVGYQTVFGIPWLAIIVAVVVAAVGYAMRTFRPARELYAIGSNPDAAALAGIPSAKRVFVAFVTSGALAGLGGALFLALFAQVDNSAGLGYELNVVAAAVVGGVAIFGGSGTVVGAALGAMLLNTIQQSLVALRISSFWDEAIAGGLLLAAISIDRLLTLRVARSLRSAEGAHRSSDIASPAAGAEPAAGAGNQGATPPARADASTRQPLWQQAARWEVGLVIVLIGSLIFGSSESSTFDSMSTLFYGGINAGFISIMALPMMLIVVTAEIDLSVASMLGLAGALLGDLWHHGWGIWPALIAALVVGLLGGALNGVLVAKAGLPSIAVTIGTLTLFRGAAEILLGSQTIPGAGDRPFPTWFTKIGVVPVPGTHLSYTTVIFIVLAIVCGVVLHATPLGRSLYAIGLQPEAARFAGIRVARIKFWLYVASGLICAFAGILLVAQNSSVSYNAGYGLELNVVAIALFGGVSIFGGKGTVPGVVLSAAIVATLQMAMTQMNIDPNVQEIVIGTLLLISVVVPSLGKLARWSAARSLLRSRS